MKKINLIFGLLSVSLSAFGMEEITTQNSKSEITEPNFIEIITGRCYVDPDTFFKKADEFANLNSVEHAGKDPQQLTIDLFMESEDQEFRERSKQERTKIQKSVHLFKGLASTLLNPTTLHPEFPNYPENEDEAVAFFSYLDAHPELEKEYKEAVIAIRNLYLHYIVKRSTHKMPLCIVLAATNLGAADWLSQNITNIGINPIEQEKYKKGARPSLFRFCKEYIKDDLRSALEKHCPASLDTIYTLLKNTPGVEIEERRRILEITGIERIRNNDGTND